MNEETMKLTFLCTLRFCSGSQRPVFFLSYQHLLDLKWLENVAFAYQLCKLVS